MPNAESACDHDTLFAAANREIDAARALADELMTILDSFASNYHAAYHYGLIDNCAVGACQDYCDALAKWKANKT